MFTSSVSASNISEDTLHQFTCHSYEFAYVLLRVVRRCTFDQFMALFCADFSNVISKSEIKALAEADEQEVVAEVQVSEVFFIIHI